MRDPIHESKLAGLRQRMGRRPEKGRTYSPAKGYAKNPLRKYPNIPCACDKTIKAKRCHGRLEYLPIKTVNEIKKYLRYMSMAGGITVRPGDIEPLAEPKEQEKDDDE